MGNIIAALIIFAIIAALVIGITRRRNKPERRLIRDFKRLRRLILKAMDSRAERKQARKLLEDCEDYLQSLVDTKEQQQLLSGMVDSASELTGTSVAEGTRATVAAFNARVADELSGFFADLARISTSAGLRRGAALEDLQAFTNDIESQRQALLELTLELKDPAAASRAALERFAVPNTPEADSDDNDDNDDNEDVTPTPDTSSDDVLFVEKVEAEEVK